MHLVLGKIALSYQGVRPQTSLTKLPLNVKNKNLMEVRDEISCFTYGQF